MYKEEERCDNHPKGEETIVVGVLREIAHLDLKLFDAPDPHTGLSAQDTVRSKNTLDDK